MHGASSINTANVGFVRALLSHVMFKDSPNPNIVPLASGGIQLEWDYGTKTLEVVIKQPYSMYACLEDHATGEEHEALSDQVVILVQNFVHKITYA
jgi:hypothetical protein